MPGHRYRRRLARWASLLALSILGVASVQARAKTSRPRVLIIGDSISMGYRDTVCEILAGVADVHGIPENGGHTGKGLEKLATWLGTGKWDLIHFNWGLHDLKHLKNGELDLSGERITTLDQYEANLDQLVTRLKSTGAKLIWASTTPIPDGAAGRIRGQEIESNTIARSVMDKHGVPIEDLHTYIMPYLTQCQKPHNVHFIKEGSTLLAQKVVRSIRNVLHNQKPPFDMPEVQPPIFPDRTVDISAYGAVGDGKTLNTQAIAKAIAACAEAGGGRVLVPPGTWLTGAIHLRSNIDLHMADGAELRFSTNPKDYLPPVFVRWAGFECYNYSPLIYANGCTNIALTGSGILEGQGKPWWNWAKRYDGPLSRELYRMVLDGVPVEDRVFGSEKAPLRPQFFQPINCRNVLIEGVTFTSGPFWTVQVVYCENVLARHVTIANEGPNNDGINADSSRNVLIEHCIFDTGDDCVALKSGLNEDGWRVGRPTENVVVRHCRMKRGHGGVVIGSDMSGGIRNVFVHDCDFSGSARGIRIKSTRGRGGVVENIWYQDLNLGHIDEEAIIMHTDYRAWFGSDQGKAPTFRNIHISDVTCRNASRAARIAGLPEQPIENITFENVTLAAQNGLRCTNAIGLNLVNVAIVPETGAVIQLRDAQDVSVQHGHCPDNTEVFLRVEGEQSRKIRLSNTDLSKAKVPVVLGDGVQPNAVKRD